MVSHDPGKKVSCNAPKRRPHEELDQKKTTKKRHKNGHLDFICQDPLLAFPHPEEWKKLKRQKRKQPSTQEKQKEKTGGGREKKHRRNFIKKWLFGLFGSFEKGTGRGKQMEDEERKK